MCVGGGGGRMVTEIRRESIERAVSAKVVFGEPVWPRGKAGKRNDLGSIPLRLSFLFKSCGLWTRSCDFVPHDYETLK